MSPDLESLWGEVERDLRELMRRSSLRLGPSTVKDVELLLDHNELGVAAESLTYCLAQADPPLDEFEREVLWAVGTRMEIDLSEWEELGRRERC